MQLLKDMDRATRLKYFFRKIAPLPTLVFRLESDVNHKLEDALIKIRSVRVIKAFIEIQLEEVHLILN